ncbi:MAG: type II toxin-antitoxin system prevent-host-death family antitoxin [Salinibacter sp.]
MSNDKREPEFIVRNGKPVAVILDIEEYREMLERLEDAYDLQQLEQMQNEGLQFRSLDEFLEEQDAGV